MADTRTALKQAGVPDQHLDAAVAMGLQPQHVQQAAAAGFDPSKIGHLIQILPQVIGQAVQLWALIAPLFGGATPAAAPAPANAPRAANQPQPTPTP